MPFFESYLSQGDLDALVDYKYTAGTYTYVDDFLSAYFWGPLVEWCPIWVAPNVLTLLGFLSSLAAAALTLFYSPELDADIPSWACCVVALLVFMYQTLDALDGKQARRTGASNSLGTLFDHGCDVLTTSFVVIINIGAVKMGLTNFSVALVAATHMCQFICIWYEYYFNYFMAASNRFFGVTEIQLITMINMLIAGTYGQQSPEIAEMKVSTLMGITFFAYQVYSCTVYMVEGIYHLTRQQRSEDRDPDIKLRRAITQLCVVVPFVVLQWWFLRETIVFGTMNVTLALGCVVVANATVCIRFILASCANRTFHTFQWPAIPFVSLTMAVRIAHQFGYKQFRESTPVEFNIVGSGLLIFEIFYFLDFVVASITGMASTLKVHVFRLPPAGSTKSETQKSK